jgi:2'-5' RNA ligase
MRVIRSFLALKPSLATVENLSTVQKRLRIECRDAGIQVRWVPPPNIHITVRFLGQITEPMSHAVEDMLVPMISGIDTFDVEISGVGVFPNERSPRVIWAGIGDGADKLESVYQSVYSRLVKAGFNFEDKPFRPHLTLGRIKHVEQNAIAPIIEPEATTPFGISTMHHFYCYQSDLLPHGAEYTAQWVIPFKKKPAYRQPASTSATTPKETAQQSDETPQPSHEIENSSETPDRTGE